MNDQVLEVQVPPGVFPGDYIDIEIPQEHSSRRPTNEGCNVTRKAARLFLRYDLDNKNSISVCELRAILINEFSISEENMAIESELAGVSDHHELSFDEFRAWYYALTVRLDVYEHIQAINSTKTKAVNFEEVKAKHEGNFVSIETF